MTSLPINAQKKSTLLVSFSCSFSVNRGDGQWSRERLFIWGLHHMKSAIKRQPIRDTVEAESTTTITLPARLTRAPSPAPTMTWASCTMQVRAAQSMPVPRLSRAASSLLNFLRSYDKKEALHERRDIVNKILHADFNVYIAFQKAWRSSEDLKSFLMSRTLWIYRSGRLEKGKHAHAQEIELCAQTHHNESNSRASNSQETKSKLRFSRI